MPKNMALRVGGAAIIGLGLVSVLTIGGVSLFGSSTVNTKNDIELSSNSERTSNKIGTNSGPITNSNNSYLYLLLGGGVSMMVFIAVVSLGCRYFQHLSTTKRR